MQNGRILMKQFKHLIKPYIIWASILIVVPLILIVLYAFTSDGNEVLTLHFTWANFAKFLETTYLSVILKSFRLGILTTLICLVCGYPRRSSVWDLAIRWHILFPNTPRRCRVFSSLWLRSPCGSTCSFVLMHG